MLRTLWAQTQKLTYPDGTTPRVCIVGSGIAGLCAGAQLKRHLGLDSFVIYERARDVGGVWLANTYPGCEADVPGWVYSYSFAQNPSWSKTFPGRNEMLAYLQGVARKYDLYGRIRFNTEVRSAVWNENSKTWKVSTSTSLMNGDTNGDAVQEFDIVILGTGPLREPNHPSTFDNFSGPKMHSAEWDRNVQLEGKVIGVVGCSSSAVQVIPAVAPLAKQLIVYMREPHYVVPKTQTVIPRIVRWVFAQFPFLLWTIRAIALPISESLAGVYTSGSLLGRVVPKFHALRLKWNVQNPALRSMLMPGYSPGYKVPPAAYASYLQTFNRPNVTLVRSHIALCDQRSIMTVDGCNNRLDVLILCTGFKILDFFAPMHVQGAHGVDLLSLWKKSRPETFYGVTCEHTPNMFFLLGPNGTSGTYPAVFTVECQMTLIVKAIRALMSRNAASIRVTASAQAACMAEIDEAARNKIYMQPQAKATGTCVGGTWLVNENGFPTMWPKSSTSYWLRTRSLNPSQFEFTDRNDIKEI